MQIAVCQFNPTVGALSQNAIRLLTYAHEAAALGAEFMLTPELALCGYPPKDLVLRPDFLDACALQLISLAKAAPIPMIVGAPVDGFNAACWCYQGQIRVIARKRLLPNYQVFDERRYFKPGPADDFNGFEFAGKRFGMSICEDAWNDEQFWKHRLYEEDPIWDLAKSHQVDVLVNLTASPFEMNKAAERESMFRHLAMRYELPTLVVGQVGANDGLIFDGGTVGFDADGEILYKATDFKEELIICKLS
ncbi:MAG: nitrilase-related carbon-nitrogen hydrolase [Myxococcota bacterium]